MIAYNVAEDHINHSSRFHGTTCEQSSVDGVFIKYKDSYLTGIVGHTGPQFQSSLTHWSYWTSDLDLGDWLESFDYKFELVCLIGVIGLNLGVVGFV